MCRMTLKMSFTVIFSGKYSAILFTVYYTVDVLVSLAGTVKVLIDKISKVNWTVNPFAKQNVKQQIIVVYIFFIIVHDT